MANPGTMVGKTDIRSVDEEDTLWQLNGAEVVGPEGSKDKLCRKDASKLFFPIATAMELAWVE